MIQEYFLWRSDNGLRLLTPQQVIDLPNINPPHLPDPLPADADASSWWPEFPWDAFDLSGDAPLWFCLDESLGTEWQQFPFESFWEGGRPLEDCMKVIREGRHYHSDQIPAKDWKVLVLDRWPGEEFSAAFVPFVETGRMDIWEGPFIDQRLAGRPDLSHYDLLLVLAHGGEGDLFLTDEAEKSWQPAFPDSLPSTVWFAACADNPGEVMDAARQCLERGAEWVIAPGGMVSAPAMARLIVESLEAWAPLTQAIIRHTGEPGVASLRHFGGGGVFCHAAGTVAECRSITLSWARTGQLPDAAIRTSDDLLGAFSWLADIARQLGDLPPVTALWLEPYLRGCYAEAVPVLLDGVGKPDRKNGDRA